MVYVLKKRYPCKTCGGSHFKPDVCTGKATYVKKQRIPCPFCQKGHFKPGPCTTYGFDLCACGNKKTMKAAQCMECLSEPRTKQANDRAREIDELRCDGLTFKEIGARYGITSQRAAQLLADYRERLAEIGLGPISDMHDGSVKCNKCRGTHRTQALADSCRSVRDACACGGLKSIRAKTCHECWVKSKRA